MGRAGESRKNGKINNFKTKQNISQNKEPENNQKVTNSGELSDEEFKNCYLKEIQQASRKQRNVSILLTENPYREMEAI